MKEYATDKLRNIALVGHQSAGKTTLVEALLYNTGATKPPWQGRREKYCFGLG